MHLFLSFFIIYIVVKNALCSISFIQTGLYQVYFQYPPKSNLFQSYTISLHTLYC